MIPTFEDGNLKDSYNRLMEEIQKSKDRIIKDFAEEQGLSLKCAEYYLNRHFKFTVETENTFNLHENPKAYMTLQPKSPEEILGDIDTLPTTDMLTDCDRELLKNEKYRHWEWIK